MGIEVGNNAIKWSQGHEGPWQSEFVCEQQL